MYYLFVTLATAIGFAMSGVLTETSQEYVANYLADNDPSQLGLKSPPAAEAGQDGAATGADGTPVATADPKAIGAVVPILFASIGSVEPVVAGSPPAAGQPASGSPPVVAMRAGIADDASGAPGRAPSHGRLRIASPADFVKLASLAAPAALPVATPGKDGAAAPAAPAPAGDAGAAAPPAAPAAAPADAGAAKPVTPPAAAASPPPAANGALPPAAAAAGGPPAAAAGAAPSAMAAVDPQSQAVLNLARDTPFRRPDGSAFMPIATQRIFSMRWEVAHQAELPMAYEIPGRIITNPGTGTIVPATLAGVVAPSEGKFPYLGMPVHAGDVLAYLQPTLGVAERAQIEARITELVNSISLTEKQIERLKEVLFVRYRENKIEALKVQIDGNRRELEMLQGSIDGQQPLRATADGVISHVSAVVGATVTQGQEVFEIVDPHALWVEAAAYDPAIAANIRNATAALGDGRSIDLEFVGGGLVLSNQAIPLRFRVVNPPEGLSVGKPVTVMVRTQETIAGVPVPTTSVIRDDDGRTIVWERLSAESFVPRPVRVVRIAGNMVMVQSGLSDGARIVVDGGSILNQVR